MLRLESKNGKYYLGNLEVVIYPIEKLFDIEVGSESGRFPPLEELFLKIVSEAHGRGIGDLTRANAYLISRVKQETVPESNVPDGKIPPLEKRMVTVQFFKAVPATEENKRILREIFSSSI